MICAISMKGKESRFGVEGFDQFLRFNSQEISKTEKI